VASFIHRDTVPGVTGLRFVAAFCVLLAHSVWMLLRDRVQSDAFDFWAVQASAFGMTLFFVLSGFVIHYNYASAVTGKQAIRGIAAYLWARFARLYPLFLLTLSVAIFLSLGPKHLWMGQPRQLSQIVAALPYFLLSVQSWFYHLIDGRSLLYSIGWSSELAWSISTEWFFYLAYPAIALLIVLLRSSHVALLVAVLWCALWAAISITVYDRLPQIDGWAIGHFGPLASFQENKDQSFFFWFQYFSPYLRIGEFVLGTIVAQIYVKLQTRVVNKQENVAGALGLLVAVGSIFVISYFTFGPDAGSNLFRRMLSFALGPPAALLIFCVARYQSPFSRILDSPTAVLLGEASYSIYLVHFGVLMSIAYFAGSYGIIFGYPTLAFVVTGIVLLSIVLSRYYELPARKWLRQLWPSNVQPRAGGQ
jgi:peptidoglycan/LPS O-acetylase OafA/YrhL